MEKNESGMPILEKTASCNSEGAGIDSNNCIDRTSPLNNAPLAYVYAPDQAFRLMYSASEALKHGTLFEELYKPPEVYGNE